jgi:hypothetical protein
MHILFLVRRRETPHTAVQQATTYDAAFLRSLGHEATVIAVNHYATIEEIEALARHSRGKTVLSGGYIPPPEDPAYWKEKLGLKSDVKAVHFSNGHLCLEIEV